MGRSVMGVRVGASLAAIALIAGPVASPAVSAEEPRGENAWWYTALKIKEAHQETTGKGVIVGLLDTPIAPTVPELKGQDVKAVANLCGGAATATGKAADHGTSMATLIVGNGRGAGGPGVAGIAPDATVRSYARESAVSGGICGVSEAQATAAAFDRAVADGARIINLSGGAETADAPVQAAVERALAAGVIVIAAAGQTPEDPHVLFPASVPGVVAVVAVDRDAKPWTQNVKGNPEQIVIAAPGVDLLVSGFNGAKWDSTAKVSGTSDAAALVSGGLALIAAKYPKATGNQLIQHLIHNTGSRDVFSRDTTYGFGVMSVTKMLASDPTQWPDTNPLVSGAPSAGTQPTPGGSTTGGGGSPVASSKDSGGGGVSPVVFVLIGVVVLATGGFAALRFRSRGGAPG